ncbi:MAG: DUF2199 domain-containing protein [Planctomycetota bacterium]|nr:DUF2199 domain-containing protein [Planctomycetota bacterium]
MPNLKRWKCATCGQWHEDLPLCFGAEAPAQWSIITDEEKTNSELLQSLCVIRARGETSFYVRGHVEIPILDHDEPFVWGVWVSLSEKSFQRVIELWDVAGRETEPPFFGWLCTAIPVYPDTMYLKTSVQTMPSDSVPRITVEPTDHPLAVDQHHGVTLRRVIDWIRVLLHG